MLGLAAHRTPVGTKLYCNDIIDKGFHVDSDTEIDNEITEEEVFQNIVEIL